MSTIVTRSGKGSSLTNSEVDSNFTNLNTDKAELSGAAFTGAITTNSTIDGRDVAADGVTADAALPKSGGGMTGTLTMGSNAISSTGTGTFGVLAVDTMTLNGSSITGSSNLTLDVAGDIILDADGSTITFKDGGTTRFNFNLDATPDFVMSGGNASITAASLNASFTIIGNDGGNDINALTFDMSAAGAATFNSSVTATSLDISGNIDVDGTTNLDVVDIDGAVDMASTLTVAGGATFGGNSRVNGDFSVSAASGEDRFAILPQSAGTGTIIFSGNEGLSAYEPLVIDFETLALRTSGTPRLSIAGNGAATFSSSVTATSLKTTDFINIQVDDAQLYFTNAANNRYNLFERDASNNFYLKHFDGSSVVTDLTFNSAGAATFASNVGIGVAPTFSAGGNRRLLQLTNGASGGLVAMGNNSSESENPRIFSDADNLGFATSTTGGGIFQFYTANTERLRIDQYGGITFKTVGGATAAVMAGSNLVNGLNTLPSAAGTPFVVARDSGTTRSAEFGGGVKVGLHLTLADGNLIVASGHGIDFSATAGSGTSELLDDYEEGTWTPAFTFDIGGTGIVYGLRSGKYTKVGNAVHVSFLIIVNSGVGSGDYWARLTGIPFVGNGSNHFSGRVRLNNTGSANFNMSVEGGTTSLLCYHANGASQYATGAYIVGQQLSGSFTYFTNS